MRASRMGGLIMMVGLAWGGASGFAQGANPRAAVQSSQTPAAAAGEPPVMPARSDKQKILAEQTDRLVAMATDLKVQVDKTNRNILSLTVVRKAEELEALARKMRDQAKR